jgi:hypothetical protein
MDEVVKNRGQDGEHLLPIADRRIVGLWLDRRPDGPDKNIEQQNTV